MAFTAFKQLGEVLKKYRIKYQQADFQIDPNALPAPEILHEDIRFTLRMVPFRASEAAICENLIYPVLKSAWKPFSETLTIWSRQPISDGDLSGVPDYVISKRSELGVIVFEAPFLAVVEAKKDDFTGGWGQCSLEMYAIQQLNGKPDLPVHGIVSNGENWEFAVLKHDELTKFEQNFSIKQLDELHRALGSILLFYQNRLAEFG